jgi:uncharacterized membrane protein
MKIETSVVINCPIEEVFVYSTDPENTPEWQTGLLESRVTSAGPIGVGSTIRDVRVFMGRQAVSMVQVVVYEPNKEFTLKVESGEIRFKARHLYESTGDGTKVIFLAEGRPNGFFKHAARLIARKMQQQFESDFLKLKHVLEDVEESTVRSSPSLAASV